MTPSPASTYRLQLHSEFGFADARALVPYFADLGVDWLYLAPVFTARPGSRHGYDVVDCTSINPELGGRAELEQLAAAAHAAGMHILLDIVPNHEAATTSNPHWYALLRDGPDAARWFDVDPAGNERVEPGRVLWPVLAEPVAVELESGALRADVTGRGERVVRYHDETLPLVGAPAPAPRSRRRSRRSTTGSRTGGPARRS